MALGDVTEYSGGEVKAIELLASATATNSPPTGSAGLDMSLVSRLHGHIPEVCEIQLYSTAGSDTMTVAGRLWGYSSAGSGQWAPLGYINGGVTLSEVSADKLAHAEPVSYLGNFERLYFEITSIGGTSTAVTVKLVVRRGSRS